MSVREPRVYLLEEDKPHFFTLPDDVFSHIIPKLNKKAVRSFAASCRLGHLFVDRHLPMRRLPSLLGDLRRLRVGNLSINPDSFETFLEAIALDGDYDRALLIPLSPGLRCAVTVAMDTWGKARVSAGNRNKLHALAVEFLCKNYSSDFENGVEEVLQWHLHQEGKRICTVGVQWRDFFANPNLSLAIRSRTFNTLISLIGTPSILIFHPEELSRLALENSLQLEFLSVGTLALLETGNNVFFNQIDQKLADLKHADTTHDMLLMLAARSRYLGPPSHTHGIIRKCAIFKKMLDAIVDLPDKQVEPILLKMLLFLENFTPYAVHVFHSEKIDYPDPLTFNPDVHNASDGETALSQAVPPAVLLFADSLRTRISKLQSTNLAQALMEKFSTVIRYPMSLSPGFADYIARTIAGIR